MINAIYERNDVNSRSKDGLELYKGYYYTSDGFDVNTCELNGDLVIQLIADEYFSR